MLVVHIPLFLFFFARTSFARLFSNPALLKQEYDFIVVGGQWYPPITFMPPLILNMFSPSVPW